MLTGADPLMLRRGPAAQDPNSNLSVFTGLSEGGDTSSRAGKSAQPPLALGEEAVRSQNGRQLGCARGA